MNSRSSGKLPLGILPNTKRTPVRATASADPQRWRRCSLSRIEGSPCTPYHFLIAVCILLFAACDAIRLNIPVEVQSLKPEEAALLALVENKSNRKIKITYPVSTGMLNPGQHVVFRLPQPGNYKVLITVYVESPNYPDVYRPVSTVEIPVFLNGYDVVRARGAFVGYFLEVTDGMLLPNR